MKRICCFALAFVCVVSCGVGARAQTEMPKNISAKAYVLIEAGSGAVLAADNANTKLPMASTTKIMSTLLTLESGDLDTEFTVDKYAVQEEGSTMGLLEGDIVTKRALCAGMMLPSGNDAANAAAVKLAGSKANFAKMMNARAAKIGMRNTCFVTPSGLHADGHYSTAYDMALVTREALKNDDFREICASESIKLTFGNPPYKRWLNNTNKLLTMYDGCIGVKTGFTDEAGRCLVSAAERGGVTLICVTLNAPDDWNDHIKLYDYGFSSVKSREIPFDAEGLKISVVGGEADELPLVLAETPRCSVIDGQTREITARFAAERFIYAPVAKGDIVGTMRFYADGTVIEEVDVIASGDCAAVIKPRKKSIFDKIVEFIKGQLEKLNN